MSNDYYQTLGVTRSASDDDIKKAYRKLARDNHPDLHPNDKDAERRFKEVQQAYDVLSDKEKRAQYDRFGHSAYTQAGAGGPQAGGPFHRSGRPGEEVHFDFGGMGGLDDLVQNLFGAKTRRGGRGFHQSPPAKGADVETVLTVPFHIACLGGEMEVQLTGGKTEHLSVTIPPGVHDGAKLRLSGKGGSAPGTGVPGDLIVVVKVAPHPEFTRDGADVQIEVPVTVAEAILGASVDVPTIEGSTISVTVPAGSSGGQRLRLRGKGGKDRSGKRGDQFVKLKLVVPKEIDEESKRLIKEFAERNPQNPRG